jgi:hypothetical protein
MIMPVKLEWDRKLPVLIVTYTGDLSADDYYTMCEQRQAMIADGPDRIVLIANMQKMTGFPEAATVELSKNVLVDARVAYTLIVIEADLHRNLSRLIIGPGDPCRVLFFPELKTAYAQAEKLSKALA